MENQKLIKDEPFSWLGKSLNAWKSFCQDAEREAELLHGELEEREKDESQGLRREESGQEVEWEWEVRRNAAFVVLYFLVSGSGC